MAAVHITEAPGVVSGEIHMEILLMGARIGEALIMAAHAGETHMEIPAAIHLASSMAIPAACHITALIQLTASASQ